MTSPFLDALNKCNESHPPIWFMRQAGRYLPEYQALRKDHTFLEMCHTPELIAEVTQLPLWRYDFDAAILFSDILTITEPLGRGLTFEEGRGPVIDRPITQETDLTTLPTPDIRKESQHVADGIKLLLPQLKVPLIGFAGAPFTVASYLIEGESKTNLRNTKKWLFQNPKTFHQLLEKITELTIDYLKLQIESGVQAIQLFDSWANVLAPKQFREFSLAYMKQILNALRPLSCPTLLFCRGSSIFAEELASIGPDGISVDWNGDLAQIRKTLGPNITLQGNLDPDILFAPLPKIKGEVERIMDSMAGDPAFIFNLGHGILPQTPLEAVETVIETVKCQSTATSS